MSKKVKKSHEGQIYLVSPKHVVQKKDLPTYNAVKGKKATNKRLVMVGVEKSGKKVQVSNMSTKATQKQLRMKWKVPLKKSFVSPSYVDSNTIFQSKLTRKHFRIGEPPLMNPKGVVHQQNLKQYKKVREQRYKKKPPK